MTQPADDFSSAGKNVYNTPLEEEARRSFLEYSYSVITSRALPDARDGLKPVHRRILFSMSESGLRPDHSFVKSARVVGNCMGRYHPHGDSAIYEALVRLTQDFALNAPLASGHGNFGSPNDGPAASRYCVTGDTRVRLADGSTAAISDIVPDSTLNSDNDISLMVLDKAGKPVHASKFFNSGIHPIKNVKVAGGASIRGSHNHLVLTLQTAMGVPVLQWMQLNELREGMFVALARNAEHTNVKPNSEEVLLGALLGGFASEGWYSSERAGFNNTDKVFFDTVSSAYRQLVGGRFYIYSRNLKSSDKTIYELDVHDLENIDKSVLAELRDLEAEDKVVPNIIWNSTPGAKRVFLQSIFEGDGSIQIAKSKTTQTLSISYSSYSQKLVEGLQELLLEFGVYSTISKQSSRGEYKLKISEKHSLNKFYKNVGFLTAKQALLEAYVNDDCMDLTTRSLSRDYVPYISDYVREVAKSSKKSWAIKNNFDTVEHWARNRNFVLSEILEKEDAAVVSYIMDAGYRFQPVVAVSDEEPEAVYSLRVDSEDHSFLAGGFVNHNTEVRMSENAMLLVNELDENTVDFIPNYDGSTEEPTVLPAAYPNLLVNGSSGIAVGMATNMIPHNLGEAIDAARLLIKKPKASLDEIMELIPGPDLPTGGQLIGLDEVRRAYEEGRGSVRIRGKAEVLPLEGSRGRSMISVTELPYGIGTEKVIEKIKDELGKKRLQGISDVKDLSDRRNGLRLVIETKTGINPTALLNDLYRYTPLEVSFGIANLTLVNGEPRTLSLKELLEVFIEHRYDVIRRRTQYRKDKAEARKHIVEGLLIALQDIDEVVKVIKASSDTSEARVKLCERFELSEIQAGHILDMPLRRLVNLEVQNLKDELAELLKAIEGYNWILNDDKVLKKVVDDELEDVKKRFATARKTELVSGQLEEILAESTSAALSPEVENEAVEIYLSSTGLLARTPAPSEEAPEMKRAVKKRAKHDTIISTLVANTHDSALAITNLGNGYKFAVLDVPSLPKGNGRVILKGGISGKELVELEKNEHIVGIAPISHDSARGIAMATRNGIVKINNFDLPQRSSSFPIIGLKEGDEVISSSIVFDSDAIVLITNEAALLTFPADAVRPQGRTGGGVTGIKLPEGVTVNSFSIVSESMQSDALVVTATEQSAKVTQFSEFPSKGRGTGGVRAHKMLKTESGLIASLVSVGPVAASDKGEPIELPSTYAKRDASGTPTPGIGIIGREYSQG